MTVTINGKVKEIGDNLNLEELLVLLSRANPDIIVELNGKIIPKEKRKDYKLNQEDRLELIQLVGGG